MGFVKEMVCPDSEMLYNSFMIEYEGEICKANKYMSWYVDKERDMYFSFLGGFTNERAASYVLVWKNKKIMIEVDVKPTKDVVYWSILRIKAAKELELYRDEIEEIICEVATIVHSERKLVIDQMADIVFCLEDK